MIARNRTGQGLSVNMMILIALGLIVLVIAALMFSRSTREGQSQISNCELLGGVCSGNNSGTCENGGDRLFGKCGDNQLCCSRPNTPS